jgi:hypothetical protein
MASNPVQHATWLLPAPGVTLVVWGDAVELAAGVDGFDGATFNQSARRLQQRRSSADAIVDIDDV